MKKRPKIIKRHISIKKSQDKWLKKHPEFNFSGWIQHQLDIFMADKESG